MTSEKAKILIKKEFYNKVSIREPYWKYKAIGIKSTLCNKNLVIKINYTNADGGQPFPNSYFIRKEDIKEAKITEMKIRGITLYIIPIEKLTEIK
jgi:hypothetical protein